MLQSITSTLFYLFLLEHKSFLLYIALLLSAQNTIA